MLAVPFNRHKKTLANSRQSSADPGSRKTSSVAAPSKEEGLGEGELVVGGEDETPEQLRLTHQVVELNK